MVQAYLPFLECPLCQERFKMEHAIRRHLDERHITDDLVDYILDSFA